MTTFAKRLKATREERDLTQKALAELSGISQTTISNIESGRNQGSVEIFALARALGVSPEWLAEGTGPKERWGPGIGGAVELAAHPGEGTLEADANPGLKEVVSAYNGGSEAKQESLRRLAKLPEQEMGTLLLVIQSIGSKYKK